MVTTIVLLICFSLAFTCGGFVAFKGVQLGLRWQIQTKQEQQPTMEKIKNPIAPVLQHREEKEQANILAEWLNGPPEESR